MSPGLPVPPTAMRRLLAVLAGCCLESDAVVCLTREITGSSTPGVLTTHFGSREKIQPSELIQPTAREEGMRWEVVVAVVNNVVCPESERVIKSCCVSRFVYPYLYFTENVTCEM